MIYAAKRIVSVKRFYCRFLYLVVEMYTQHQKEKAEVVFYFLAQKRVAPSRKDTVNGYEVKKLIRSV